MFGEGRTNVHSERRSARPSVVNDYLVENINENVRENEWCTIHRILGVFAIGLINYLLQNYESKTWASQILGLIVAITFD